MLHMAVEPSWLACTITHLCYNQRVMLPRHSSMQSVILIMTCKCTRFIFLGIAFTTTFAAGTICTSYGIW